MDKMLQFRRQFLLSKSPMGGLSDWKCLQIDQYYLYAHPDLEITRSGDLQKSIVLIGCLFDSMEPKKGNSEILKDVLENIKNFRDLILWIKRYAGSYSLLYKDAQDTVIFHDALALREIYYCTNDNQIVCGSQPNLITEYASPDIMRSSDPDLLDFYESHLKNSRWNPIYKWIGDETFYNGVKHLLPNHYLDIKRREACRYWPNEPIRRLSLEEAVSRSCLFLQGILKAISLRHSIMMAVTAGIDSRILLAASKGIENKIYYFINKQELDPNHPDISVPKKIFESIGIPFHIEEDSETVDDEFRRILLNNAFFASERILPTIYNVYYKRHSEKVNIVGIGEIGRTRYGKVPRKLNGYRLVYKIGYREGRYVITQGEKILTELLPVSREYNINTLTLFYWEHTLGNWGSTGNTESDIAIEELNPYNSHLLYEFFLGVEDRYTRYSDPILLKEIIRNMWPQLLKWPINPPYTLRGRVVRYLKKTGSFELLKEMKYQICFARYLIKTNIYKLKQLRIISS